ncbi:MAG: hypothetical protein RMJ17_04375 [Candidatus Aenigmarchaeota archaeon]|nr:hypothetical protein [Candidatus Aenigmarchaeota archaeon]MDW8149792.1 hypothetical protein [Candidatus Aenigmarchaeota archaeon]
MKIKIKKGLKIDKKIIKELRKIKENIVICIGGNGTLIYTLKRTKKPILPIRTMEEESLGFKSDLSIRDYKEILEKIEKKEFYFEDFNKIIVTADKKRFKAVNDVVIFRKTEKEVVTEIFEEKEKIIEIHGDGLIITSSFGSTAYNLKANGPITKENILIVTPINANIKNSYVTSKKLKIIVKRNEANLEIDGKKVGCFKNIKVKISNEKFKIVKLKGLEESLNSKIKRIFTT